MNTEQLKLIIEMVNGLGAGSKEAFVWWLVMDRGLAFLGWVLFLTLAFILLSRIAKYVRDCNKPRNKLEDALDAVTTWWLSEDSGSGDCSTAYKMREEISKLARARRL